jgi:hypothetical protein
VYLQRHLLGVDHDRRSARGTLVRPEQRGGLLRDARRFSFELEALDELPSRLRARAGVCARIAPNLLQAVAHRDRVDSGSAVHEELLDGASFRGDEHLFLAHGPHGCHPHPDVVVLHRLVGPEAKRDLVRQGHVDRVASEIGSVLPPLRLERGELPLVRAGRCPSERRCALSRVARSGFLESSVASEAPGAVDEDADADSLGLRVADRLDLTVLGHDDLRAARDRARVRV